MSLLCQKSINCTCLFLSDRIHLIQRITSASQSEFAFKKGKGPKKDCLLRAATCVATLISTRPHPRGVARAKVDKQTAAVVVWKACSNR